MSSYLKNKLLVCILTIYLDKLELGLDIYMYVYMYMYVYIHFPSASALWNKSIGLFNLGTLTLSLTSLIQCFSLLSILEGMLPIFRFSISSFEHGIFNTRLSSGSARRAKPGSARALEEAQRSGVLANDCNNYAYLSLLAVGGTLLNTSIFRRE